MPAAEQPATVPALSTTRVGVTDRWVDLPGRGRFHYVSAGPSSGPLLVFLHGLADSWRSAAPLIPHLDDSFSILALDQRGHGETGDRFEHYRLDDLAADAAAFIAALGRRPAALIGHSLGSLVAQRVAAAHGSAAESLVLIGATDSAARNPVLAEVAQAIEALPDPLPAGFIREFQAGTVHRPLPPGQLDAFVADSLKLTRRVWGGAVAGLGEAEAIAAGRIELPTLIIWGEEDAVFGATDQERLRRLLAQSSFVRLAETGHAPHWERPQPVAEAIRRFLG
jgi:non-heme chloroperoxidase